MEQMESTVLQSHDDPDRMLLLLHWFHVSERSLQDQFGFPTLVIAQIEESDYFICVWAGLIQF